MPFVVGLDRYLPSAMGRVHPRWGTPHIAILVQGILSTLFILMSVIGSSVKEAYLVLIDATLIVYFIPYLYLFISLPTLRFGRRRNVDPRSAMEVPGGRLGLWLTVSAGFGATLLSIILALVPPKGVTDVWTFEGKIVGETALLVLVGLAFYWRGRRRAAE